MRIGVVVYGRLNKCVEHYDNIINSIGIEHTIDFFLSSDNSSKDLLDNFINLYNPVSWINDKINHNCYDLEKYQRKSGVNVNNMLCHFINKQRVYTLLENYVEQTNTKYDIIMSIRIDMVFYEKIIFNNEIEENTIYIPKGYDYIGNTISDTTAYGNISVMKKYMNIIQNIIYILDMGKTILHPESLNFENIKLNNLKIKRYDLKYDIIKSEGRTSYINNIIFFPSNIETQPSWNEYKNHMTTKHQEELLLYGVCRVGVNLYIINKSGIDTYEAM
jgi:hypothetical protein